MGRIQGNIDHYLAECTNPIIHVRINTYSASHFADLSVELCPITSNVLCLMPLENVYVCYFGIRKQAKTVGQFQIGSLTVLVCAKQTLREKRINV